MVWKTSILCKISDGPVSPRLRIAIGYVQEPPSLELQFWDPVPLRNSVWRVTRSQLGCL
jgi:hypothetical protein